MTEKTPAVRAPRKAPNKSLAVAPEQTAWTRTQVNALHRLGFEAPARDLELLFHVVRQTGLDPFVGQLYMAQNERDEWEVRTTQAGLLSVARRVVNDTGETLGIHAPEWSDAEGHWTTLWSHSEPPAAARVTVVRDGDEFTEVVMFAEYAVFNEHGRLSRTWLRRGAAQLAKCARSASLRMAFPHEMSGLYTDDEMAARRNPVTPGVVVAEARGSADLDDLLAEDQR